MSIGGLPPADSDREVAKTSTGQSTGPKQPAPAERHREAEQAEKVANQIREMLASIPETDVQISYSERTGVYVIKVLDSRTGQIIREAPPEKVINAIDDILRLGGLYIDKAA
jgi:flagellar protein FlaG